MTPTPLFDSSATVRAAEVFASENATSTAEMGAEAPNTPRVTASASSHSDARDNPT